MYATLEVHVSIESTWNVSRSVTTYLTLELTGTECSLKHGTTWYCVARPPCWIPFDDITLHLHQSKLHDIQNSQFARAKNVSFWLLLVVGAWQSAVWITRHSWITLQPDWIVPNVPSQSFTLWLLIHHYDVYFVPCRVISPGGGGVLT